MNEELETGVSRRTMIKRGAIVGGAAWAAPAVTSLGSIAGAGTPISTCDTCQPGDLCFGQIYDCQGDAACICAPLRDGSCVCWDTRINTSCAAIADCLADSDCAGNERCVPTCCYSDPTDTRGKCVPNCGTVAPRPAVARRAGQSYATPA